VPRQEEGRQKCELDLVTHVHRRSSMSRGQAVSESPTGRPTTVAGR
jgi:hypothetical protein